VVCHTGKQHALQDNVSCLFHHFEKDFVVNESFEVSRCACSITEVMEVILVWANGSLLFEGIVLPKSSSLANPTHSVLSILSYPAKALQFATAWILSMVITLLSRALCLVQRSCHICQ
jgi:hypothetical protein